jgi:dipeptidase
MEEIELWNQHKGFSAPRQHSKLRGDKTPTLEEYRKHMGIKEPPPEPEMMATTHELDHFYEELSTLTAERVRFLYRQRWEKCRLKPGSLPSTLDAQYLGTTLRVLKDMKKGD